MQRAALRRGCAVDVVVPVAADARGVRRLLERLRRLRLAPGDTLIVVDNRGAGVAAPEVLVATAVRGSYYARNAGAARGRAPWILFLDADVEAPPDLLDRLLTPEPPDGVGVIAGAVLDAPGPSRAERYAARKGSMAQPLDGPWGFAQTAHCAVRRAAFEAVGGFDARVRSGGDADLCFRLRAAGWGLESRPWATVVHRNRTTIPALLRQRARHGAGAAWLAARWPGALPARSLPGVACWGLKRAAAGLRSGDREARLEGLLDGPAVLAFELGRRLPNRVRRGAAARQQRPR